MLVSRSLMYINSLEREHHLIIFSSTGIKIEGLFKHPTELSHLNSSVQDNGHVAIFKSLMQ